ncbi:MAG: peptidylprolyl isomerase [Chloroflexota bacterium]
MSQKISLRFLIIAELAGLVMLLAACKDGEIVPSETIPQTSTTAPSESILTATPPPLLPSTTPVELAAQVNGEGISLEEYETELALFRAAADTSLATYEEENVLEDMIDQVLLAQAAIEAGFVVDEVILQTRIDQLDIGETTLQDWTTVHGYTEQSFRRTLTRSIAAAWMRDQIILEVPNSADQVHARQILLYNLDEATNVFAQLEAGTDFETLAAKYKPLTSGDLGWFPRGYLTVPELDEVIFALDPGAYGPVIETSLGFHIVQVIEHDPQRPLSPDTYRVLQIQALQQWLNDLRSQSEIVILNP